MRGLDQLSIKAVSLITSSAKSNPKTPGVIFPTVPILIPLFQVLDSLPLLAARNAGVNVPESVIDEAINFMTSCQDEQGGFGYTTSTGSNLPRTAIGSLVLSITGKVDSEAYKKSVGYLKKNAPYGDQGINFTAYITLHRRSLELILSSGTNGMKKMCGNSWIVNKMMVLGGVITDKPFCTCAALLSMALNYRYLPIYER